jgi:hypothetical protein
VPDQGDVFLGADLDPGYLQTETDAVDEAFLDDVFE